MVTRLLWIPLTSLAIATSHAHKSLFDPFGPGRSLRDYCPTSTLCEHHTLCEHGTNAYYEVGPLCHNAVNVYFSKPEIEYILKAVNTVRSFITHGTQRGYNGELLPKGYGVMRVEWDDQLATLGKITANQCRLEYDQCRATYRFPKAGQLRAQSRHTYPGWGSPRRSGGAPQDLKVGFTEKTMDSALKGIFGKWYSGSKNTKKEHILSHPMHHEQRDDEESESVTWYLQLVHGAVTHIGCGAVAHTSFPNGSLAGNTLDTFNVVLLVCNFSLKPGNFELAYSVTRAEGSSERCGCPPGASEDENCLCYYGESGRSVSTTTSRSTVVKVETTTVRVEPTCPVVVQPATTQSPSPSPSKKLPGYRRIGQRPPRHLKISRSLKSFGHPRRPVVTIRPRNFYKPQDKVPSAPQRAPPMQRKHGGQTEILSKPKSISALKQVNLQHEQRQHKLFSRTPSFHLPSAGIHFIDNRTIEIRNPSNPPNSPIEARLEFSDTPKVLTQYQDGKKDAQVMKNNNAMESIQIILPSQKDLAMLPLNMQNFTTLPQLIGNNVLPKVMQAIQFPQIFESDGYRIQLRNQTVIGFDGQQENIFHKNVYDQGQEFDSRMPETKHDVDRRLVPLLNNLEKGFKSTDRSQDAKSVFGENIKTEYGNRVQYLSPESTRIYVNNIKTNSDLGDTGYIDRHKQYSSNVRDSSLKPFRSQYLEYRRSRLRNKYQNHGRTDRNDSTSPNRKSGTIEENGNAEISPNIVYSYGTPDKSFQGYKRWNKGSETGMVTPSKMEVQGDAREAASLMLAKRRARLYHGL